MTLGAVITPPQRNGIVHGVIQVLKVHPPHHFGTVESSMDGPVDPAEAAEMCQLSEP